uniref:Brain and acute leukemia cytoplasmic protein-like n=1 Tax=Scleropages formosus TaxID=113540 RepID=A0A8C9T8C9_SCLFO
MGCGGSRASAIEPRCHGSWTRETETTWLPNTDVEAPSGAAPPPEAGRLSVNRWGRGVWGGVLSS